MARGVDSSRDPRRQLSPQLRNAVMRQAARRMFLTGQMHVDPVGDVERKPQSEQANAVWEMALRNEGEVAALMQPELGVQRHTQRGDVAVHSPAVLPDPSYGMTRQEWDARQRGGSIPAGVPTSRDPFSLGKESSTIETQTERGKAKRQSDTVVPVY